MSQFVQDITSLALYIVPVLIGFVYTYSQKALQDPAIKHDVLFRASQKVVQGIEQVSSGLTSEQKKTLAMKSFQVISKDLGIKASEDTLSTFIESAVLNMNKSDKPRLPSG